MDRNPLAEVPEPTVGPGQTFLSCFQFLFVLFSFFVSGNVEGLVVLKLRDMGMKTDPVI